MRRWLATCALALVFVLGTPAVAQQTASERMHEASLKRGNTAYNGGDYKTAIASYIAAIQANPNASGAYRNLARAFFWDGDYAMAVEYYDNFLRLAPGENEKIKAERRLAAERAGDRVYTPPESQRLSLLALNQELETGRAYTSGGGGAWGLYETLLRTRYAEPQLAQIRARLVRRLLDEFDANLIPKPNQLTPRLDLDGWQLQAERLASASSIADDPGMIEVLEKRATVAEAAIAMLTSRWQNASDLARMARQANPDLDFIVWYEVSSLIGAERFDEALLALMDYEKSLKGADPVRGDYVRVLRAVTLQRLDRDTDAAGLYLEVLRR